jgi:hypothetical protein
VAISSLLDIAWTHAYWTEGPEFVASAPAAGSSGDSFRIGAISLNAPSSPSVYLDTWPDEVGTDDLTQATSTKRPQYIASDAGLNNKPVVHFERWPTVNRSWLKVQFAASMSPIIDTVLIGRLWNHTGNGTFLDGYAVRHRFYYQTSSTPDVYAINPESSGFSANRTGGVLDTSAHLWRYRMKSGDQLVAVDGTTVINNNAANPHPTLDGLTIGDTFGETGAADTLDLVFVGLYSGELTSTQLSDLRSYCQTAYGTG